MESFYTTSAVVLIAIALATTALVRSALRMRSSIWGEILDRVFLLSLGIIWLIVAIRYSFGWSRGYDFSLPLILTGFIAPLALSMKRWPLRLILYYGSIGLFAQTLLTPALHAGPSHLDFWFFWLAFGSIAAAAVYDLAVNRYRPTWRDYSVACLAALLCIFSQGFTAAATIFAIFTVMTIPWTVLPRTPRPRRRPVAPPLEEDSELIYST